MALVSIVTPPTEAIAATEAELRAYAGLWAPHWTAGDVVLLSGPLGAGKTTFVRGVLEALGHQGPVRSPTFNLVQTFDTVPPVLHADLFRVDSAEGLGLDEAQDMLCLIEWPERHGLPFASTEAWSVAISVMAGGRRIEVAPPTP